MTLFNDIKELAELKDDAVKEQDYDRWLEYHNIQLFKQEILKTQLLESKER